MKLEMILYGVLLAKITDIIFDCARGDILPGERKAKQKYLKADKVSEHNIS